MLKKGNLVEVRSDIPPDYRVGGIVFTKTYHVPLRGLIFRLDRKTSKGNWYYDPEEKPSVVFSEEMLILVDAGSSGIFDNIANNYVVNLSNILNNKENENRLQKQKTFNSGRNRREGSTIHGRRNKVTIAVGHLSYKARFGKS